MKIQIFFYTFLINVFNFFSLIMVGQVFVYVLTNARITEIESVAIRYLTELNLDTRLFWYFFS